MLTYVNGLLIALPAHRLAKHFKMCNAQLAEIMRHTEPFWSIISLQNETQNTNYGPLERKVRWS